MKNLFITLISSLLLSTAINAEDTQKEVVQAKQLIGQLKKGRDYYGRKSPFIGVLSEWNISVNSVNQSLPTKQLEGLYTEACQKAELLWKGSMAFYKSPPNERGSRYCVISYGELSRDVKQVVIGIEHGNDSSSFVFFTVRKPHDYSKGLIRMASWKLNSKKWSNKTQHSNRIHAQSTQI